MGSSGAGKTTMMNILAQRNLGGLQIGGTLRANGQPYDYQIGNISSYVQQDDIFVGSLTVKGSGQNQGSVGRDDSSWDGPRPSSSSGRDGTRTR